MIGAGLLARKRPGRRLQAVGQDLAGPRLQGGHGLLRAGRAAAVSGSSAHLVGFGCTTLRGSGPLAPEISKAVDEHDLVVASVLSGNRNFEGRINPDCRMNYLASPPWWWPTRWPGRWTSTCSTTPRHRPDGTPVYLRDLLAVLRRGGRSSARPSSRTCSAGATPRCSRATSAGTAWTVPTRRASPGTRPRPTCAARRTSTACRPPRAGHRHPRRPGPGRARRQRHHRPHLARRGDQARQRPAATWSSRASSRGTSTPTGRGGATTR